MTSELEFSESSTQLVSTGDIAAKRERAERDMPTLIVMSGADVGVMYRVDRPMTIVGRSETADIRIIGGEISRHHVHLYRDGKVVAIEDLGSTNGTHINGNRISGRRVLADGDKIALGSSAMLKFTYHDEVEEDFQKRIHTQASRDALTGVFNRQSFDEQLRGACAGRAAVALILVDADHFKQINDTHGHPVGDRVLAELARRMAGALRQDDYLARYGGEEFVVLCRRATPSQAVLIGERLRQAIAETPFEAEGRSLAVTVSVGISTLPSPDVKSATQLLATCDAALYCAKLRGRNRVVSHRPEIVDGRAPTDPGSAD